MSEATHVMGRCLECGEEWYDERPVVICPECYSRNVEEFMGPGSGENP